MTRNNCAPFYTFHCSPHNYMLGNKQSAIHIIHPCWLTLTVLQVSLKTFNFINPFPTSRPIKQVVLLILVGYNVLLVNVAEAQLLLPHNSYTNGLKSPWKWCYITGKVVPDVSKHCYAFIFRNKQSKNNDLLNPEDGSTVSLQNVGNYLPSNKTLQVNHWSLAA
jgi:hypothetical protein